MSYQSSEQNVNAFPLYPDTGIRDVSYDQQRHLRKAGRIFGIVFFVVLLPSLIFTFVRSPVYLSEATLLINNPANLTEASLQSTHNLAVEKSLLLSQSLHAEIIDRLMRDLIIDADSPINTSQLSEMLSVQVTANNLLQLRAEGEDQELLVSLMVYWIDSYRQKRATLNESSNDSLDNDLANNILELENKVEQKRSELVTFRELHNIESTQREDNQIVARLKKITESLNQAQDDLVNNEVKLNLLKQSIARGEPLLPAADQNTLGRLEQRAMELREQIEDIESQFTPDYVSITPKLQAVYDKYRDIQQDLEETKKSTLQLALSEAKNNIENSASVVKKLKRQRAELKQKTADFNANFARHNALQEDLNQITELLRLAKTQLAENQASKNANNIAVEILTSPSQPIEPIYPLYTRDALLSVAIATLLGLIIGLVYLMLTRPRGPLLVPHKQQIFYPVPGASLEGSTVNQYPNLSHQSSINLPHHALREISEFELKSLLEAIEPRTKLLVYMIMAGNNPDHLVELSWEDLVSNEGLINLPEDFKVHWPAENQLSQLISEVANKGDETSLVWCDSSSRPMDLAQLDQLINYAAHDAGLTEPQTISLQTLHYTYLTFLARQGLRLSLLSQFTDELTSDRKDFFSQISPPGKKKSFAEINLLHPILIP